MNESKRITLVLDKPNPLFEKWLLEWSEEAKKKGSKMERTFNYALTNLRKYKIPLFSGQECKILKGFGDKLCRMLDDKLAEYKNIKSNCLQITKTNPINNTITQSNSETYIPQHGSGAYAILMALYTSLPDENYSFSLSKEDIINMGKPFSNTSFIKPDPGSYYTAWSSMKTLIEKGLVIKKGRPIRYSLTEVGYSLSKSIAGGSNISRQATVTVNDEIISKIDVNSETDVFSQIVAVTESCQVQKSDLTCALPSLEVLKKITSNLSTLSSNSCQSDYCTKNQSITNNNKNLRKYVSADMVSTGNRDIIKTGSKQIKKYSSSCTISSTSSSSQEDCFIFEPNSFDIILYVDTQETSGYLYSHLL